MALLGDVDLGGQTLIVKEVKTGFTAVNQTSNARQTTAAGSALTLTRSQHLGKTILLDTATGSTITLPAATGTGDTYHFLITTTVSSNNHIVKVANVTDVMIGGVITVKTDAAAAGFGEAAATTDDTITMNGTTTGGAAGSKFDVTDVASGTWCVTGILAGSGTLAGSLFSATV